MDGLRLDIDNAAMQEMIRQVGATQQQAKNAVKRALRRLQKHIISGNKKDVATRLGVAQKRLAKRYYSSAADENGCKIWAGTWAIDALDFGKPRQSKTGVRVGRLPEFRGAFAASPWPSKNSCGVFIRQSSKHYRPDLYGRSAGSAARKRGSRYPLVRVRVPVEDAVIGSFSDSAPEYKEFFLRQLEAELNYQVNVKGKQ